VQRISLLRRGGIVGIILTGFLVGGTTAAVADSQTSQIRKTILDAIAKNDPGVCVRLFTDHGVVDDVNALYVRGFNGPQISDPDQARATCQQVHARNATPARSLVVMKKLKVKGATAQASVEVGIGGTYDLKLVRLDRQWKIDAVS
jgi:hypothetical protein